MRVFYNEVSLEIFLEIPVKITYFNRFFFFFSFLWDKGKEKEVKHHFALLVEREREREPAKFDF